MLLAESPKTSQQTRINYTQLRQVMQEENKKLHYERHHNSKRKQHYHRHMSNGEECGLMRAKSSNDAFALEPKVGQRCSLAVSLAHAFLVSTAPAY